MHKADSSVVRIWGSLQRQLEDNVFYTRGWQTREQPENHRSSFLNIEIPKATSTLRTLPLEQPCSISAALKDHPKTQGDPQIYLIRISRWEDLGIKSTEHQRKIKAENHPSASARAWDLCV